MSRLPDALPFESELLRGVRAVLFLDVVESVRIMERHEEVFVRCWLAIVKGLRNEILPQHRGRIVKSHGDGCLLVFDAVVDAAHAALTIHDWIRSFDQRMPADAPIRLRMGIHLSDVVVDELDLFGAGVNLAARLAASADPGATLVSAAAREPLVDGMGLQVVDLGEHWLRHIDQPVRVYRILSPDSSTRGMAASRLEHRPGIAVLPFKRLSGGAPLPGLGHALADDLTAALSRCAMWRVISRLSMARCHAYTPNSELAQVLGVPYLISGSYRNQGKVVVLHVELCDGRRNEVLWAGHFSLNVADLFACQDRALPEVVQMVGRLVLNTELTRSSALPFSCLEDYSLHLSAMALMHRLTPAALDRSRQLIGVLEDRHRRSAEPAAMLARWHALRMVQGWTDQPAVEARRALAYARSALERDSAHSFALPMAALLSAQTGEPLLPALNDAQRAMAANPQEPMAGLAFAMLRGYQGDPVDFERYAEESARLTPLDPALYVYLSMLASAKLSAGKVGEAIDAAASAIRANTTYSTAHLMMTMAQSMAGNAEAARQSAAVLLSLEPGFRIGGYLSEFSGRHPPSSHMRAQALAAAGLPP